MTNAQRKHVLTAMPPCHAFFENLAIALPELSLQHLKDTVEHFQPPNMAIFEEFDKDITRRNISFTLNEQLGELVDDSESWLYILTTLANNALQEDPATLPSWENFASYYGYTALHIATFKLKKKTEKSPMERLISVLYSEDPSITLFKFTEMLKKIHRSDAVEILEEWAKVIL